MSGSDLIHVPCRHSVKDAVVRLKTQLKARDIPLFAEFDHKANAVGAGLAMPEATVLVFGNPAVGTKLIGRGKRNCGQVERTVAVAGRERVFLEYFAFEIVRFPKRRCRYFA